MLETKRFCFSLRGPSSSSTSSSAKPMMVCRGERSSWLMLARNSLFSRSLRSTSALRCSNCRFFSSSSRVKRSCISWKRSSATRRAVTSRTVAMTWKPSSEWMGLRLISTGKTVPSLRRACNSRPEPMGRVLADLAKDSRFAAWRSRTESGTRASMPRARNSSCE
jgi:hypothetical protein